LGKINLPKGVKDFFNDSMWTIAGLLLLNVSAQFAVYPFLDQMLGSETYGNVLTLISYANIISISIGTGCNSARMQQSSRHETANGEYNRVFAVVMIAAIPLAFAIQWISGITMDLVDTILYAVLLVLLMLRYYCDVDFRLRLDYKGMFLYYLSVALGYLVGLLISKLTGRWAFSLIIGEALCLVTVSLRGKVLRQNIREVSAFSKEAYDTILALVLTQFLSNVIFNSDRLLLNAVIGGEAVTTYYVASLLGKTVSLVTSPLNNVIIGHMARYKGGLKFKTMMTVVGILAGFGALCLLACTIASYILIPILYPQEFDTAKAYFILANLASIIFSLTGVLTSFLLVFNTGGQQLEISITYVVAFLVICIPATLAFGLNGFMWGIVAVNVVRFVVAGIIGIHVSNKSKEEVPEE